MSNQKEVKQLTIPFGPTSRKQQMIMDCEAQILIMGGEVAPQYTVTCIQNPSNSVKAKGEILCRYRAKRKGVCGGQPNVRAQGNKRLITRNGGLPYGMKI